MVLDKVRDILEGEPSPYECQTCDTSFESRKEIGIARCPECGGSNLIPAPE